MLKKVLIVAAIVLLLAVGAVGIEAYRVYRNAMNLGSYTLPKLKACPTLTAYQPALLPWTDPRRSGQVSATTTPTPTALRATGTKAQPCDPAGHHLPTLTGRKRINILVLGSDTDAKFDSCQLLAQTIMVVTIDPVHKKVGILSIPRDSWVAVPGSIAGDPTTYHKMDEAMSIGEAARANSVCSNPEAAFKNGVAYEKEAVYQNFGIHIDYYAWIGLQGFKSVITTLHGVCINAVHPMLDDMYPKDSGSGTAYDLQRVYIPAGPQCMDGATALQYVRTRHSDQIGDFGRGQRDEQMLIALRRKLAPLGLTDFLTINNLIDDVQGYVKSDLGSQMLAMADFARQIQPGSISKVLLTPPKYSYEGMSPDGTQDVVYLNWPAVQPVIQNMFAPIGSHRRKHHPQPLATVQEAMRMLLRVSGATPAPRSKTHAIQHVAQPVRGTIYYVANGNVWSLTSSGTKQVTHTTAVDAAYVTPNGRKLVYYRRWSENNADVWLRDMVKGTAKQITQSHATDGVVGDNAWFVNPVISPNGKTVIYASDAYKYPIGSATLFQNPDCQTSPEVGGIDLALYSYNVATGTATQVTAPCEGAGGDADPRFDPAHPSRLVYTEFHYLANSSIASRLVLLNLNSGVRTPLTPFSGRNLQAAWQPNGRHMAWLGSSDQSTTLYEAPFSGGSLHKTLRRVVDSGMISQPEFSPDGRHLIYFKLIGNAFQIFEVNLRNGWPVGRPMQLLAQADMTASGPLVWIR